MNITQKNHSRPFVIPPAPVSLRRRRQAVLYLAAGIMIAYIYGSGQTLIRMPACPLRSYTGLLCAGCGSVRATLALVSGNFATAWRFNPAAFIFFPLLLWTGATELSRVARGRTLPSLYIPAAWIYTFLATLLLYTLLRNIPFPIFDILRP